MFRSMDLFAEEEPPFGFGAVSRYGPDGQVLIGVKTHLGIARPRWTPSGSMWLDGEQFSLPLSRFDPKTLEPVFGRARAAAATMGGHQPVSGGSPAAHQDRDRSWAGVGDQRRLLAVDTHLGRARPQWDSKGALSLEIDGVRRPLHHFSADQMTPLQAARNDEIGLPGSLGSDTLAGGRGQDDLRGEGDDAPTGPLESRPQPRPDQSRSQKLASTGPMPWDPSRGGWAGAVGRWARDALEGPQRGSPQEPVTSERPPSVQAPTTPPLVPGTEVDWTVVAGHETPYGRSDLDGHIPALGSGVTVGHGVDLGQWSARELQNFGLSDSTLRKSLIFAGLTDSAAKAAWKRNEGANFEKAEADELTTAVRRHMLQTVTDRFNAESTVGRFEDLPPTTQTVIMDVYFHHGHNAMSKTPKFWRAITTGNWQGAKDELMVFGDNAGSRRKADARMLQEDIEAGRLPAATTRRQ